MTYEEIQIVKQVEECNKIRVNYDKTMVFRNEGQMMDYFLKCDVSGFMFSRGEVYHCGRYRVYCTGITHVA